MFKGIWAKCRTVQEWEMLVGVGVNGPKGLFPHCMTIIQRLAGEDSEFSESANKSHSLISCPRHASKFNFRNLSWKARQLQLHAWLFSQHLRGHDLYHHHHQEHGSTTGFRLLTTFYIILTWKYIISPSLPNQNPGTLFPTVSLEYRQERLQSAMWQLYTTFKGN